jgi:CheY-like chemotaxis protein
MAIEAEAMPPAPVLVVEDHDDTREMIATLLGFAGYTVVTAANGKEGLECLLQTRPCLVLLDLTMPIMTGWEFRAAQLSVGDPALAAVPVLLLTAMPNAEEAGEELQATEVIKKPFDYDRLIESVGRHCRSQRD